MNKVFSLFQIFLILFSLVVFDKETPVSYLNLSFVFILCIDVFFIRCVRNINLFFIPFSIIFLSFLAENNMMLYISLQWIIFYILHDPLIYLKKCSRTRKNFYSDSYEKDCPICLETFQLSEKIVKLECGHLYHRKCIRKWFNISELCPYCRT